MRGASGGMRVARGVTVVTGAGGCWMRVGGRRVEGGRPTPGLLMVRAGSDSSIEEWRTVSERARHKVGVGTAGMPAQSEGLDIVHRQRSLAIWEDMRQPMLIAGRWFWREGFTLDTRTCGKVVIAVFLGVIPGVGAVRTWWWELGGGW